MSDSGGIPAGAIQWVAVFILQLASDAAILKFLFGAPPRQALPAAAAIEGSVAAIWLLSGFVRRLSPLDWLEMPFYYATLLGVVALRYAALPAAIGVRRRSEDAAAADFARRAARRRAAWTALSLAFLWINQWIALPLTIAATFIASFAGL